MSHKAEQMICPNCGHHATDNYCSQCGQENHLHSETFFGLIMHFIGHYFHYDSKFWKTVAALLTKPGKLTLAYWNKQRMRYIPPISLYIFVSVVFFLVYSALPPRHKKITSSRTTNVDSTFAQAEAEASPFSKSIIHSMRKKMDEADEQDKGDSVSKAEEAKADLIKDKLDEDKKEVKERVYHMLPKVFFFLIPLMGFVLQLLFMRRKELNYASHVIFALHYHTLWFVVMLAEQFYRFHKGHEIILFSALLITVVYFVAALKKTYDIGWGRSVLYSFIVGFSYLVFLIIAAVAVFMIVAMPYIKMASEAGMKA